MKTLISILAHADVQDTFERHFHYWKAHESEGAELLFRFPGRSSFHVPGHQSIVSGKKEHDGVNSIAQFYSIMEHMAKLEGYDRYGFMEYDSFCLGTMPEMAKFDVVGNIFHDDCTETFKGGMYVHPPFFVSAAAMPKLMRAMQGLPFTAEQGFWDRWLGLAVKRAQLSYKSLIDSRHGFSHNTIHREHHDELRKAILSGATAIHGVKDNETLKVVQLAWNHARMRDEIEQAGDVLS